MLRQSLSHIKCIGRFHIPFDIAIYKIGTKKIIHMFYLIKIYPLSDKYSVINQTDWSILNMTKRSNCQDLKVYKRNILFKGSTSASFLIVGEIGQFKHTDYVLMNVLEGEKEVKVYPLGTHKLLFDQLVGYVFIDYRRIAKYYRKRFPRSNKNIASIK